MTLLVMSNTSAVSAWWSPSDYARCCWPTETMRCCPRWKSCSSAFLLDTLRVEIYTFPRKKERSQRLCLTRLRDWNLLLVLPLLSLVHQLHGLLMDTASRWVALIDAHSFLGDSGGLAITSQPVERIGLERPGAHIRGVQGQKSVECLVGLLKLALPTMTTHVVIPGKRVIRRQRGKLSRVFCQQRVHLQRARGLYSLHEGSHIVGADCRCVLYDGNSLL